MITVRALRKRFGAFVALDGISVDIGRGAFALLLGSNGAGKTTLLRCILGLCGFDGTVRIGGRDVASDGQAARALVGYVPQRPALPPDATCAEAMDLLARLRGLRGGNPVWLERVGLAGSAGAAVRTLSGGMRQRLALAIALQADPAVLLFDEPAANLDVGARRSLHRDLAALASDGRTVLLATHLAAEPLQSATQAMVLESGRLVYDGPATRLRADAQQRVLFGMNGIGRPELRAVLSGLGGVEVSESAAGITVVTHAGGAFELVAAVAAAGIRPVEVHIEEPAIDPARLVSSRVGSVP